MRRLCGAQGNVAKSLPVRGAWVEIDPFAFSACFRVSLPVRGAWVEIRTGTSTTTTNESLPVRGAWVEIRPIMILVFFYSVAPRAGSVG